MFMSGTGFAGAENRVSGDVGTFRSSILQNSLPAMFLAKLRTFSSTLLLNPNLMVSSLKDKPQQTSALIITAFLQFIAPLLEPSILARLYYAPGSCFGVKEV